MHTLLNDNIVLPSAPAIAGLTFRHFQGEEDYAHILAILHSSKTVDQVERADTLEELVNNYTHLVNCDLRHDFLFAEIDHLPVAYCRVEWAKNADGENLYNSVGHVKSEYRNQGIGRALLFWAEDRLRTIAAENPVTGIPLLETWVDGNQTSKIALLEQTGYSPARYFHRMVRPDLDNIPHFPLPEGAELRPVTPDHYRPIWNAMMEAFKDHWSFVPPEEEHFQAWQNSSTFQPDLWQIAWAGDAVIGTVLGYIDEAENKEYGFKRGWTEEITVQSAWRGKGVAKALITACLLALKARGMQQAALGVDTQNLSGATRLYESMGYQPVHTSIVYRKPLEET